MSTVCVFCGSSAGVRPAYRQAARDLGTRIAGGGHRLVYGGAGIGLMGEVADAALRAGGEVIGVVPTAIDLPEITHARLSTLHRVGTMHQRKALMAELSDLVVTLPGGVGTLEEISEMLCWSQLGIHRKPLWLLDVEGYYRPLLAFLAHAVAEGFLDRAHRDRLQIAAGVDELPLQAPAD
jgi:uncharacterized protein (TIGR00730 family)